MASASRLAIRCLSKTFGAAKVLDTVDLTVEAGEVHGLAGANGSGKSTLVKILTGMHRPDDGARISVDGRQVRLPVRWQEVHAAGVSVVHQDLGLLDELTVADNVCVGGYPRRRRTRSVDRRAQHAVALRALERVGADIDPARQTDSLAAHERAEVAIARALRDHDRGSGLILLDESTRTLAGSDLARIHGVLRALVAEGASIVLISHSLPELLAVTDRVTIIRDGRITGDGLQTRALTEAEMAGRMLGADAAGLEARPAERAPAVGAGGSVRVTGLTGNRVAGVSFTARTGEITGVTGLPGSGYEEIPYLVTGATRPRAGTLELDRTTVDLSRASVGQCMDAGVVLVPEQRIRHGLALELSVRDNVTLPNVSREGRRAFIGRGWEKRAAAVAVDTFGIRPRNVDQIVRTLSGGNQQKVLLAKWLGAGPTVLVLHEPTQAVDVGARRDILRALRRAADDGVAVVLVSGEPTDLCEVCDRIYCADPEGDLVEVGPTTPDELLDRIYTRQTPTTMTAHGARIPT